jgi:hypothetical protein
MDRFGPVCNVGGNLAINDSRARPHAETIATASGTSADAKRVVAAERTELPHAWAAYRASGVGDDCCGATCFTGGQQRRSHGREFKRDAPARTAAASEQHSKRGR